MAKKELIKSERNRVETENSLLKAVNDLVEDGGFECLGINAVATKAGVSKMLIYRYFGSLDGLIAAYIGQYDYWINYEPEWPEQEDLLGDFLKEMFRRQIILLRENYTLRHLYRWELASNNEFVKELRKRREEKGLWLVESVSRLSHRPLEEVAAAASLITASISYLVLLEENCPLYNGIPIQDDVGWAQIEKGIDLMVDLWIIKK